MGLLLGRDGFLIILFSNCIQIIEGSFKGFQDGSAIIMDIMFFTENADSARDLRESGMRNSGE